MSISRRWIWSLDLHGSLLVPSLRTGCWGCPISRITSAIDAPNTSSTTQDQHVFYSFVCCCDKDGEGCKLSTTWNVQDFHYLLDSLGMYSGRPSNAHIQATKRQNDRTSWKLSRVFSVKVGWEGQLLKILVLLNDPDVHAWMKCKQCWCETCKAYLNGSRSAVGKHETSMNQSNRF